MIKKKQSYSAPALEKGLDILELLSDSTTGLSQAEMNGEHGGAGGCQTEGDGAGNGGAGIVVVENYK